MDLRQELLPPVVDQWRIDEIGAEITRIADLVHQGLRSEADTAMAEFSAAAGRDYGIDAFLEYDGARSLEDFAREAARPPWPRVPDVTRSELVEIVRRIQAVDPDSDYYLLLLRANTPHPHVSDLIFYPPDELVDGNAAAIVDAALAHRAIAL
ncbi:hypothetical protein [Actinospica robiniae]|uniref:hypothetical protein n=1 Tax=Actinospica robiniae TaxID=304901 RepID=UPI0004201640|nr:hypothetical protein [Actinospica robiniae]